ncbi:hypothetical protein CHS0354_007741 [Potamilus streckersoni]|uniref:BPTI/Kunitz inhibitor domain-containing protein n=1 Tax=Potamilus streckersoni TaxID=2493646 RepID=A0AAE0VHI1_9BIVA|nr:hypothetical protein CHS0354_007741 [Potamilus streckersoni]
MKSLGLMLVFFQVLVSAHPHNDLTKQKDRCSLLPDSGVCLAYFPMFFYNASSCKCEEFIYGGCGGNDNRFQSKSECQELCGNYTCPKCSLPSDPGPCRAIIPRFYFNTKTCRCESFIYGGCQGNGNNFPSMDECVSTCSRQECQVCGLPSEQGPCKALTTRYFFNFQTCLCENFTWGGCNGNGNNFISLDQCQKSCKSFDCPICSLPANPGPCKGSFKRYFFNSHTCKCESFVYGGCGGNANRFTSKTGCQNACQNALCFNPTCYLSADKGGCEGASTKWYFNSHKCRCEQFVYRGCDGNKNRFDKLSSCMASCGNTKCPICNLPVKPGPCKGSFKRYYFNIHTCQCEEFIYGGCQGNENNFDTIEQCVKSCGNFTCPVCNLPPKSEKCKREQTRYYFETKSCSCKTFNHSSCGINSNNFFFLDDCERSCRQPNCDFCTLAADPGPCEAAIQRYYYDVHEGHCKSFIWGGCMGNLNNFQTMKTCKEVCGQK